MMSCINRIHYYLLEDFAVSQDRFSFHFGFFSISLTIKGNVQGMTPQDA